MLLVNARAGMSPLHGIGLIAHEPIPAGTRIWTYREGFDITLTREQFEALSPPAQRQALHYGWYIEANGCLMISADDDRFTNHSDKPNTAWDGDEHVVATRDIRPGEELTLDYGEFHGTDLFGWSAFLDGRQPG